MRPAEGIQLHMYRVALISSVPALAESGGGGLGCGLAHIEQGALHRVAGVADAVRMAEWRLDHGREGLPQVVRVPSVHIIFLFGERPHTVHGHLLQTS